MADVGWDPFRRSNCSDELMDTNVARVRDRFRLFPTQIGILRAPWAAGFDDGVYLHLEWGQWASGWRRRSLKPGHARVGGGGEG